MIMVILLISSGINILILDFLAIPTSNLQEKIPLMRSSVIIAMVMLLKLHLKTQYSLSEEYVFHLYTRLKTLSDLLFQ